MMKVVIKFIKKVIIYFFIFYILLNIRVYWDSYRFYKKAVSLENSNLLISIRYYNDSINSKCIFSNYSNKSRNRLKELSTKNLPQNMILMIKDIIK